MTSGKIFHVLMVEPTEILSKKWRYIILVFTAVYSACIATVASMAGQVG
jgi:Fe2+ transport system protein B